MPNILIKVMIALWEIFLSPHWATIGSDIGLAVLSQANIWTNAVFVLIVPWDTYYSAIWIG